MTAHWYRVERRDAGGRIVDWVEVGRCAECSAGVDREFPAQYREVDGTLYCRACADGADRADGAGAPATVTEPTRAGYSTRCG